MVDAGVEIRCLLSVAVPPSRAVSAAVINRRR
jgi:hypothetical protein